MSETTTRLPRRRLRAWPASGGAVQMSATPEGADETTVSPAWEVPAGDVAEAMAVLSTVVDPAAMDLKTQRDAMAHELENAKREIARLERERDEASASAESEGFFAHEFGDDVVKLRREVKRLTEESARSYSQGVEDMRSAAMAALRKRDSVEWALGGEYGGVDAARIVRDAQVSAQTPPPAPRDSHMTSEVRALVKRYGAPAIAAEAARQAKEEGR